MQWIRVATRMKSDPRIARIAADLKVRVAEAVGLVACVLMELPEHAVDGDIAAVPDPLLEQWALWSGAPGGFAAAFRSHMCDDGIVRAWEKHNGAAIREANRSIARAREWRRKKKAAKEEELERDAYGVRTPYGTGYDSSTERGTNPVTNGDRTVLRDETRRSTTHLKENLTGGGAVNRAGAPPLQPAKKSHGEAARTLAARIPAAHQPALDELLGAVPNAEAWSRILLGLTEGLDAPDGRAVSGARLGHAIAEYVAAGKAQTGSPRLFRAFVQRTSEPAAAPAELDRWSMRAWELEEIRKSNAGRLARGEPLIPEPTWAGECESRYPDRFRGAA